MTLPFGTRVLLNISQSGRVGVVTGSGAALDEAPLYAVVWEDPHPGTRPLCHAAAELTVVESPAESALREIGSMLDLPPDADPAAIVGTVADLKARLFAEVSKDDTMTIEITIRRSDLANPAIADSVVGNHVYLLANAIFEWGGEHNRRHDGTPVLRCHGHHVAQGLADTVVARWKQYETKTEEST